MILSGLLILLIIGRMIFCRCTERKRKITIYKIDRNLKEKIFSKLQKVQLNQIEKRQIGDMIEIITTQTYESSRLFAWNMVGATSVRLLTFIVISIILCLLNFQLGIVIVTIYLFSYGIVSPLFRKNKRISKKIQEIMIELQANMNEFIDSYATTKTLRLEKTNVKQIQKILEESKKELLKSNRIIVLHNTLFSILSFTATIITIYLGGISMQFGMISAATVMLMIDYIDDMKRHVETLLEHIHLMNYRAQCFCNIFDLLEIPIEKEEGKLTLEKIENIEFQQVGLTYDKKNKILEDLNLKINHPMRIALVGKSGAGKTSLINLIPRFYDICEGTIKINGVDITQYDLKELRKNIAYVFQDPVIFEMSIIENIRYGNKEDIATEEIITVCKKLGLDKKITLLEKGYETIINAKSDILSYGEKQLLNFARAILKKADIILLDEVTSNLDLEFENQVMEAMEEMLKGKFAIIIAHRLNTIRNADQIMYLKDKCIIEQGTHEELLEKKQNYYEMYYQKQALKV